MKKVICMMLMMCLLGGGFYPLVRAGEVLGDDIIAQRIDGMIPAFDSIMRVMRSEERTYDPADPEFFWGVLYHMGVNFGYLRSLSEPANGYVIMPRKAMQEYATAAFLEYSDLLPVPPAMSTSVEYDNLLDAYKLGASDIGDSWTQIDGYSCDGMSGVIYVSVGMYAGEGEKIDSAEFAIRSNPYVDGISEPLFYYSVERVTLGSVYQAPSMLL